MEKEDLLVLQEALKIFISYDMNEKCEEYAFGCSQCEIALLYEKLESFVNFWLEEVPDPPNSSQE